MFDVRRRRIAWLLTLVLMLELALLCCASTHFSAHNCHENCRCAICEYVRLGQNRAAVVPLLMLALSALLLTASGSPVRRHALPFSSLLSRRVRFND